MEKTIAAKPEKPKRETRTSRKPQTQTKRQSRLPPSGSRGNQTNRAKTRPSSQPYMVSPKPNARAKPNLFGKTKPASISPPSRQNPYGNPSATAQGKPNPPLAKSEQPAKPAYPIRQKRKPPLTRKTQANAADRDIGKRAQPCQAADGRAF